MREATKRGAPIEIDDFERRLRSQEPRRGSPGNPLRELARLMQSEEQVEAALRYARMFGEQNPVPEEPEPDLRFRPASRARGREEAIRAAVPQADFSAPHAWREPPPEPIDDEDLPPPLRGPLEHEAYEGYDVDPAQAGRADGHSHAHASAAYDDERYHEDFHAEQSHPEDDAQFDAHGGTAADVDPTDAALGRTYSGGEAPGDWYEEAAPARPDGAKQSAMKPRVRPWHAVALAAVIGVGGIGWGLAHIRGKIGSREIATIAAPDGPVRVAPTASQEEAAPSNQAAVLDRQENTPVVNVESHQEQAVEPVVVPPSAPPSQVEQGLPRKRVKTLSFRAGAPVDAGPTPPAVERAAGVGHAHGSATTTPKTPGRPATTGQSGKPHARQTVAAAAPEAAAEEPAENAAAEPEASNGALAKGGFAVQFGAAASEAEARALATKVAQKYGSHLGGRRPTFKMATVGDKTVYRVRVGGISKESAVSVCTAVKSGGGNCFVASN